MCPWRHPRRGDVITDGRIASMGDAYVHGRIDSHNDVTACAHTPDWVTVPKKDRGQPVRAPAAKSRRETMW